MIELEKKLLLTKEEFNSLLLYFGNEKQCVKQVNYYFDTEDLSMNRQGVTCRIRLKNGTYTLVKPLKRAKIEIITAIISSNKVF